MHTSTHNKKCSVWISKCAIKKLCMRFCGLSESMREERKRSQEAAEKLFMAYGSRKRKNTKNLLHLVFQFSLIPILRIDLSLQHCEVCAYQFFVIISLHTALSLSRGVCRWKNVRKLLYLYFLHLIKLHSCYNIGSSYHKYRAYHLRNMRIDGEKFVVVK